MNTPNDTMMNNMHDAKNKFLASPPQIDEIFLSYWWWMFSEARGSGGLPASFRPNLEQRRVMAMMGG